MCGISGSIIFNKKFNLGLIQKTLNLMKNRGPDDQSFYVKKIDNKSVNLLHSRLQIIDLNDRANQPMTIGNYTIVFNGEIYNYREVRDELIKKGYKFKTNSDTEVLLCAYIEFGKKCVDYFIGMWAFAIWDNKKNYLFLSRDLFGEKPLYYTFIDNSFFFGSEIKFIKALSDKQFNINKTQVYKRIFLGYKSLHKSNLTFYNKIYSLENSTSITVDLNLKIKKKKYYNICHKPDKKINENEASKILKRLVIKSLEYRMRSDVPVAFCLSGGVDSSFLASIAKKKFKKNISTFSIIDSDERYNEKKNIELINKNLNCKGKLINLEKKDDFFFKRLSRLTNYHDAPINSISYYIHSFLSENISKYGFKVVISGVGADEIFTGYYDHYLLHLALTSRHKSFKKNLSDWEDLILPHVRNPILRNPLMYIKNQNFRDHIFEENFNLIKYSKNKKKIRFSEKNYSKDILRNRMLNELFHENVPPILCDDDLNSMYYSIENRSPYLDRDILNFSLQLPSNILIKNGFNKNILRKSSKGILMNNIRLDRKKKGFNASINSLIDLNKVSNIKKIFNSDNPINDFVNLDALRNDISLSHLPNHHSKLIFSLITTNYFLEQNNY